MTTLSQINKNILISVVISLAVLAFVFYTQFFLGLRPCKLCVWQRWPHILAVIIGLFILFKTRYQVFACYIVLFSISTGLIISIFHYGVELRLWLGPESCSGITNFEKLSPEEFLKNLLETPIVRCDEISWSFLDISMAGWNAIISIFLCISWSYNASLLKKINKA